MATLELTGRSSSPAAAGQTAVAPSDLQTRLLHGLLWASVLLNFVLCFIDTNIFAVDQSLVIAGEAAILATAVAVPFMGGGRHPGRWDLLLILLLLNWLILSLIRQYADPKLFRDVAIIPIFIVAGLACRGDKLHITIFRIHMLVLAFALWEAISLNSFISVFNVSGYFAHTRGLSPDEWWIENGLYVSSIRPEARFIFPGLPVHRLSSVFLEPVSLGNYVVIATLWLVGFWHHLPRKIAITAAIATALLLVGSDSRLATVCCMILLLAAPFKRHLTAATALLVAPAVIAATFIAVSLLQLRPGLDDFPGRVAYGVYTLRSFGVEDFAGLSLDLIESTQDAGFAYVINSHSVMMAIILWIVIFARRLVTPESRYIHFAIALYLSLNLIVSWSLFSIKTAGLLWFLLGHAIAMDKGAALGLVARKLRSTKQAPAWTRPTQVGLDAEVPAGRYRRARTSLR